MINKGLKDDNDKLQYHLIPDGVLEPVIRVLMYGAKKYGAYNWMNVLDAKKRYINAIWRHFNLYKEGQENDIEIGISHLACIICSCMFLLWFDLNRKKGK